MTGGPWAPASPCTEACVAPGPPGAGRAVTARRYAAAVAGFARAAAAGRRLGQGDELRDRARALLSALDVTLECETDRLTVPVPGAATGTLVVANHISWLDPIALLAVQSATLLAKREVGQWPVAGALVRRAGTRFIDREGLRRLPETVRDLAALLREGQTVIVFPEGTTWCTAPGGPFRRATLQAALDAGAPVRPVTLTYTGHGVPTTLPAYVGEGTFASSFRRVAAAGGLSVRITAHAPLSPAGHDRRSLAAAAHAAVASAPELRCVPSQRLSPRATAGHEPALTAVVHAPSGPGNAVRHPS